MAHVTSVIIEQNRINETADIAAWEVIERVDVGISDQIDMDIAVGLFASDLSGFLADCYETYDEGYTNRYEGYCQYWQIAEYYDGWAIGSAWL